MMGFNGIFAIIAAIGGVIFVLVVVGTVFFGEKIRAGHKLTSRCTPVAARQPRTMAARKRRNFRAR